MKELIIALLTVATSFVLNLLLVKYAARIIIKEIKAEFFTEQEPTLTGKEQLQQEWEEWKRNNHDN